MNLSIENFPEPECPEKTCPEINCLETQCPDLKCPEQTCPVLKCPDTTCPVLECPEISCPACESNDDVDRKNEELIQKKCDENDNLAEHGFVEETNPVDFKEGDLFLQKNLF